MPADPHQANYGRKATPEEIREAIEELNKAVGPYITGSKKVSVRVVALRRLLSALADQE